MRNAKRGDPYAAPASGAHGERALFLLRDDTERDDELALLERVRAGDREAFGQLVDHHLPRALSVAMRLLRHRQDAEDLVQDAFLAALQHIDRFDPSRPFWPWFSRIMVNRGFDLTAARSVRSSSPLTDALADARPSPAELAERSELTERFEDALASLPARRRLVVQLYEVDGFSVAEIARLLDSAPATIRWHLHVSRRQLRKALALFRGGG
jgi:RNA polymerase sigma-70 factor (ECF subfamily)